MRSYVTGWKRRHVDAEHPLPCWSHWYWNLVPHCCFRLCGFGHESSLRRVFLVIIVLAEVMKSLSGFTKKSPELIGEDNPFEISEKGEKNDISIGQFLGMLAIICVILFVMFLGLL